MSAKAVWPEGVGRLLLDRVESTNAEGAGRAADAPLWILAAEQTGGRGRRGRPWSSPRGNFHATLVLRPTGRAADIALRSFVAALALHDACAQLTGLAQNFSLKWPNDVLLNGGKLAGILLESAGSAGRIDHLVVGIGVNLIANPDPALVEEGALRPVSLLSEAGLRIQPERFLDALAPAFAHWDARLSAEGFAPLRAEWLARAARLGEVIRARTGQTQHEGRFETLDESGALVLATETGRRVIPAADVFF